MAEKEQWCVGRVADCGDVDETAATRIDNAELRGITAGHVADEAGRATVVAVMAQQRRIDDIVEADERNRNAEGADPQIVSERAAGAQEIGRASCRERVCQYV